MSLVDDVRTALRVVSTKTDDEIQLYIDAAVSDMRRVGIRDKLLEPESMTPLARSAVVMFCKATYGHDNSAEFPIWWNRYQWSVLALMNSSMNECDESADESSEGSPSSPSGDESDGTGEDSGGEGDDAP